jgi:TRAP-type mannitol/chloroaromatic compound transport system permease large subunit
VDSLYLVTGLLLLILLGAPIALAMMLLPVAYILATGTVPLLTVPHQMYEAVAKPALVAVPFFMLTGELMNSSSITDRILELSGAWSAACVAAWPRSMWCRACSSPA